MFLARNRMLTRVVAKQAKTTKVKNKFVNGKKKFKRILSCLFGGRGKVQFRRKENEAKKFRRKVQICLVGSVRTRSAHRLSSQLFAAVSTTNIAELVLFGFFLSTTMVCTAFRTHFARKNTSIFMLIGSLSRRKK